MERYPIATCRGIITDNGKILLVKRGKHGKFQEYWALPGGHIDWNEKSENAVKREVKEETGLDFIDIRFFDYSDEIHPKHDWHAVALDFTGKAKGKFKIDGTEITDIKYFSLEEIKEMELAFNHKQCIFKYFKQMEVNKND